MKFGGVGPFLKKKKKFLKKKIMTKYSKKRRGKKLKWFCINLRLEKKKSEKGERGKKKKPKKEALARGFRGTSEEGFKGHNKNL